MKEQFDTFSFKPETLNMIELANGIIADYQAQGFRLTVRQLYYQFVARDLIENSYRSYKRLGSIVANGRLAGLIDWSAIEDRTRNLQSLGHWDNPSDIIGSAAHSFRIDKWADQPNRVEVWIEKEALAGVIQPVCNRNDVAFFPCRGYSSLSELYGAGGRFGRHINNGQEVHVLHLADHDPSGIDMTRNIIEQAELFTRRYVDVDRLALNFDQINMYNPPPNFAKATDSRYGSYVAHYGTDSWELDALDPTTLSDLIEAAIVDLRDDDLWEKALDHEAEMRAGLRQAANRWNDVVAFLDNGDKNENQA